jgi:hypothetical protein
MADPGDPESKRLDNEAHITLEAMVEQAKVAAHGKGAAAKAAAANLLDLAAVSNPAHGYSIFDMEDDRRAPWFNARVMLEGNELTSDFGLGKPIPSDRVAEETLRSALRDTGGIPRAQLAAQAIDIIARHAKEFVASDGNFDKEKLLDSLIAANPKAAVAAALTLKYDAQAGGFDDAGVAKAVEAIKTGLLGIEETSLAGKVEEIQQGKAIVSSSSETANPFGALEAAVRDSIKKSLAEPRPPVHKPVAPATPDHPGKNKKRGTPAAQP